MKGTMTTCCLSSDIWVWVFRSGSQGYTWERKCFVWDSVCIFQCSLYGYREGQSVGFNIKDSDTDSEGVNMQAFTCGGEVGGTASRLQQAQ